MSKSLGGLVQSFTGAIKIFGYPAVLLFGSFFWMFLGIGVIGIVVVICRAAM